LPLADSINPELSTTAVLPAANPGPFIGRAARSLTNPVTCDSGMGVVDGAVALPVPLVPLVPVVLLPDVEATRTALTVSGVALEGTDHVS
jgi:hypothetical protein